MISYWWVFRLITALTSGAAAKKLTSTSWLPPTKSVYKKHLKMIYKFEEHTKEHGIVPKLYRGFMTMGGKFYYHLLSLLFVFWASILWRQTYWVTRPLKTLQPQVLMLPFRNSKTIMENLVTLRRKRLSYSHHAGEIISSIFCRVIYVNVCFQLSWILYITLQYTVYTTCLGHNIDFHNLQQTQLHFWKSE